MVLAEAGVRRLGLDAAGIQLQGEMIPAVAQGALALEARVGDEAVARLLAPLHDPVTALETTAERSVMIALSGSCVTPLGALARLAGDGAALRLDGFLAREDGSAWTTASRDERFDGTATAARALGGALAEELRRSLRGGV